jgi:hypothetical protein
MHREPDTYILDENGNAVREHDFERWNQQSHLYTWLTETGRKRVGIVMADFPGPGLIQQIIALNHTAVKGF